MLTVYCDTCIYRDYYEWRPGHKWLHFGEEAKKLFDRIEAGEFSLVISDHLTYQLKGFREFIEYIKKIRKNRNLIEVKKTKKDIEKASLESENNPQTEFEDALHAELAIKGGAKVLVTDNIEHFALYEGKIKIRRPELVGLF